MQASIPGGSRDAALVVIFDGGCAFCCWAAGWLDRHDRGRRLRLEPIADRIDVRGRRLFRDDLEKQMHVVDSRGRVHTGFRGWRRIAREVPVLRPLSPLLWLPGAVWVGDRAYRWIAAHRSWFRRLAR